MIKQYFLTKIRYNKINPTSGLEYIANESYLVDALTHAEAEARIIKESETLIRGEFSVSQVRKYNVSELITDKSTAGDSYFLAKISFMSVDVKSGKEKRIISPSLVNANTLEEALKFLKERNASLVVDYEVESIVKTPIMDVFNYVESTDDERKD